MNQSQKNPLGHHGSGIRMRTVIHMGRTWLRPNLKLPDLGFQKFQVQVDLELLDLGFQKFQVDVDLELLTLGFQKFQVQVDLELLDLGFQ